MGKRIDDLKGRLLDELEDQWNHLGLDEQMSYVERIASLCNGSQLLGVCARLRPERNPREYGGPKTSDPREYGGRLQRSQSFAHRSDL